MEWMKLSDLSEPGDFAAIHGRLAAVVHLTKDGKRAYQVPCIARYNMKTGVFISEDDVGYNIMPTRSGGDVKFLLLPELEGVELFIPELVDVEPL